MSQTRRHLQPVSSPRFSLAGRALAAPENEPEFAAEPATSVRRGAPPAAASDATPEAPVGERPRSRRPQRKLPGPYEVVRAVGAMAHLLKVGPAVRTPGLHRALHRLGVLDRLPESWDDEPVLERLPWGAESLATPRIPAPDGLDAPWPQPPVVDERFYTPVIHPDEADRQEHFRFNVARYMGQVLMLAPGAAGRALFGPRLIPIDDTIFVESFSRTSLGQFIDLQLSPEDRAAFARDLEAPGAYARLDFSFAPSEHTLPGVSVAPTVTLLRRRGETDYEAVAMRVGGRVFRPGDGDAWALARYFALQGAQTRMVNCHHPRLHFPGDTINAISRATLPPGHLLYKLIRPHTRFTPGLHEAVIHHRRSVLHNSQRELYSPFAYTTSGIHAQVSVGHRGLPGSTSYTPYEFGNDFLGEHVTYGRYRRDWFALWLDFTSRLCQLIPRDDLYVPVWADHIADWLPGFPRGHEIFHGDNLARALATYLGSVTVFHAGDHHSYASLPLERLPMRLRVPSPDQQLPLGLDLDALVSPEDFFRHQLAHAMFFRSVVIQSLRDVRYGFRNPQARDAARRFEAGMDTLDLRWAGTSFPSSSQISCSLQY